MSALNIPMSFSQLPTHLKHLRLHGEPLVLTRWVEGCITEDGVDCFYAS